MKPLIVLFATVLSGVFISSALGEKTDPSCPFAEDGKKSEITMISEPEIRENGIYFGNKGLLLSPDGKILILAESKELTEVYFNINTPAQKWMTQKGKAFSEKKLLADIERKTFTFTAQFPIEQKNDNKGSYSHIVKVLPDGLIEISIRFKIPENETTGIKEKVLFLMTPFSFCENRIYRIDGKSYNFADNSAPKTEKPENLYSGKASSFEFAPDNISTFFAVDKLEAKGINLRESRLLNSASASNIQLRIFPKDNTIKFILDLRKSNVSSALKSSDIHEGVDFWASDRLHVPDYTKCKNLIQNPSFEAGLRYYAFSSLGIYEKSKYENLYECDSEITKFGNHSLKIHAVKGMRWPCSIGTFAIPLQKGQKYTVSCYANPTSAR